MSEKDNATKLYMERNGNFADAFNYYVFDGTEYIIPDELESVDTSSVIFPEAIGKNSESLKRYRDILKCLIIKKDKNASYILLGIENQSYIDYSMPIRAMLYDAIQYAKQVDDIAEANKQASKGNAEKSSGEFLSKMKKGDKVCPVITLVINFSQNQWDGPISLSDMTILPDERFLKFMPEYKLNLIDPFSIADKDFDKFHTELKQLFSFLKYSKNKEKMQELVSNNKAFEQVSNDTVGMINILTGSKIRINEKEEEINMCLAIQQMQEDSFLLGQKSGEQIGLQRGEQLGLQRGEQLGIENLINSLYKFGISNDKIALELQEKYNMSYQDSQDAISKYLH